MSVNPADRPHVIHVTAGELHRSDELTRLIRDVRDRASHFIFLSGGASKMAEDARETLFATLQGLADLSNRGWRIAVGDGGTKAGIMEAAGAARAAARDSFPLIGVSPAPEITATGEPDKTPVEPRHSHIVAVRNPAWIEGAAGSPGPPPPDYWGSEVEAMVEIFARLCDGRPSVALVANGGGITLREMRGHLDANRRMLLLSGSGRAADAVISLLDGSVPADGEVLELRGKAERTALNSVPALYARLDAGAGAAALADTLATMLASPS